jgi:hypothetical protein
MIVLTLNPFFTPLSLTENLVLFLDSYPQNSPDNPKKKRVHLEIFDPRSDAGIFYSSRTEMLD